jgi:Ca-activated chloride channel family protein
MPKMPVAVGDVLVVGVGDPATGKFIDGRQSRQDVSALRQIAIRLGGTYVNGNEQHLSSALLAELTAARGEGALERLGRREYALIAIAAGAGLIALLPLLLHLLGTAWRPGALPAQPRA